MVKSHEGEMTRVRNFATGGIEEESDGGFDVYSGGSGRTVGRGLD